MSVFWETVLVFSLINLSWKSPVWMVCLVNILLISCTKYSSCGVIHISVHYYTFKKRKLSSPETNNFLYAFHHWWDWFCNPCSRDFKGLILMSKGVLFVILAQTRFMEITCLIRYDSSPASYHVTANNFKFTTSLICTFVWLHFPTCYLRCFFFFFPPVVRLWLHLLLITWLHIKILRVQILSLHMHTKHLPGCSQEPAGSSAKEFCCRNRN